MRDGWPVSLGNVSMLGSLCPPVPMGPTVDRRRMEMSNITAVSGKRKGHLGKYGTRIKSGCKGFDMYNLYSELKWGVEVAAVVPQAPPLCYERKQQCYDKHSSSHSKIIPTKSELT